MPYNHNKACPAETFGDPLLNMLSQAMINNLIVCGERRFPGIHRNRAEIALSGEQVARQDAERSADELW